MNEWMNENNVFSKNCPLVIKVKTTVNNYNNNNNNKTLILWINIAI